MSARRGLKAKRLPTTGPARVNPRPGLPVKRAHRQALARAAERHWRRLGERERRAYLDRVRRALVAEGFHPTPFQWRHKGHSFGLVRTHGDRQIHVRVYENGLVDAEVELHRRYMEHLVSPRPSAHRTIRRIFAKHHLPLHFVNEHYLPRVGAHRTRYPKTRTKVSHVAGSAASVVGSVVLVYAARLVLRRLWRGAR